jgi:hypothetical protein
VTRRALKLSDYSTGGSRDQATWPKSTSVDDLPGIYGSVFGWYQAKPRARQAISVGP